MNKIISEISKIGWHFNNTYGRLPETMLSRLYPVPVKSPKLIIINNTLSKELDLDFSIIRNEHLAAMFAGNFLPEGSEPIAQAYAGHQFGYFTMLGDGRAIIIGEHLTKDNRRVDIQFKGSGITPYSRNADGRAALGPMLREFVISEAMHALNIPTSRSLAVVKTGENVIRETSLPGAILTRVATSHIRVGTFQYVAMQNDVKTLKMLLDYTIDRHYPNLKDKNNPVLTLLETVIKKQTELVTNWMRVGFIHGVMNTDNMTIFGETIDYGPCAFMDIYNPKIVFSSIDHHGRYAYGNQPDITNWNLLRFAETLIPLINKREDKAVEIIKDTFKKFNKVYKESWLNMMRKKLGLFGKKKQDENLINQLLSWMSQNNADYTNTFCYLMKEDFVKDKSFQNSSFKKWYKEWRNRIKQNKKPDNLSLNLMRSTNPLVIPRNHKVEEALDAANNNDLVPLHNLLQVLKKPYERPEKKEYQLTPLPSNKEYKTFCGT
jgi:uncharacterized protein YdiU (UPF0061 family)